MALELATSFDLDDYQSGEPERLLESAEAAVRAYCGWHIAPSRDDTVTIARPWSDVLMLPTLHLTAVTSITEDGVELDTTDYLFNQAGFITRPRYRTPVVSLNPTTVVEFTHGYEQPPADLQRVVLALADRNTSPTGNLIRVGQVQYASGTDAFSDAEMSVLDNYRLPRMA